jgi:hypothetical protein
MPPCGTLPNRSSNRKSHAASIKPASLFAISTIAHAIIVFNIVRAVQHVKTYLPGKNYTQKLKNNANNFNRQMIISRKSGL